jgi:hypothetical protein
MEQLEIANARRGSITSPTGSTENEWPTLESVSASGSGSSQPAASPTSEVSQWLNEARSHLKPFEDFLGASTKELVVGEDPEEPQGGGEDPENADQYEFAVDEAEYEEGEFDGEKENVEATPGKRLANLPPESAPIGLIAGVALKNRHRTPSFDEKGGEGLGVARKGYFEASEFF